MARIRANNASGGGGTSNVHKGQVSVSTTATTINCGFTPKTVIVDIKASNGTVGTYIMNTDTSTWLECVKFSTDNAAASWTVIDPPNPSDVLEIIDGGFTFKAPNSTWNGTIYYCAFD